MRTKISAAVALLALSLSGAAFAQGGPPPGAGPGGPPPGGARGGGGGFVISTSMLVESNSFPDGGIVPAKNSMNGGNVQPDFRITGIPATAQSLVLIFHDIEIVSGGATGIDDNLHWMVWNIPVTNGTATLEEGKLPDGAIGKGGRGAAYMGPGAPAGVRYHHYVFDFYALNAKIDLPATAGRPELTEAMKGKIVGKASYVGRFKGEAGAGGGAPRGGGAGGPPGGGAGGPPRGPGGPPPGGAPGGY
jgi:Raf kinase inhibitor-like YbhB/YbcL family protein